MNQTLETTLLQSLEEIYMCQPHVEDYTELSCSKSLCETNLRPRLDVKETRW